MWAYHAFEALELARERQRETNRRRRAADVDRPGRPRPASPVRRIGAGIAGRLSGLRSTSRLFRARRPGGRSDRPYAAR